MSKSADSDMSRINIMDDKDTIRQKIKRAKSDGTSGLEFNNPDRPECHNLLTIFQLVTGMSHVRSLAEKGVLQSMAELSVPTKICLCVP